MSNKNDTQLIMEVNDELINGLTLADAVEKVSRRRHINHCTLDQRIRRAGYELKQDRKLVPVNAPELA